MPEPEPSDPLADATRLLTIVNSSWMSQAARVAAELDLADLLAGGPRSVADLAAATGTHEPSLHRLLRALVTIDVCREEDDGTFALTPMGRLLVIERLIPERMQPVETHRGLARSDLNMLVAHAAQERTEAQFRELLAGAGLRATAVTTLPTGFNVIEAVVAG